MVEARICPTYDTLVVRIELKVDDLLVARARDGDGGGKSDFYRGANGGKNGV